MKETIESAVMGEFHYNESNRSFEINKNNWKLEEVEKIFLCLEEFDQHAKLAISARLIAYKNDF